MVFPNDVYAKVQRGGGKMTDSEKSKIIMGAVLAAIVGIIAATAGLWSSIGIPMVVMILVGLILWIFICIQVFRFLVFREQDRDLEESDMFLPYYKIRPGSAKVKSIAGEFDMYELKNSSFMAAIQIRMGRNTEERTNYTKEFFNSVQDLVHEKDLKLSIVTMKEDFMESEEATRMLKNVNMVAEPQLRASLLAIYNEVFSFAEEHGSVMCYYLMIYAKSGFTKDELEDAMVQIVNLFKKTKHLHALRSLQFLDQTAMFSFFRRFYGMGAIDLSLSKVQFNTMDSDVLKSIVVYRVISKTGKSYGNPILDKIESSVRYL